jgi:hypothetical protein
VVNRLDLVPELPLASLKRRLDERLLSKNEKVVRRLKTKIEQRPCYSHVNTLVYIDRDGEITADADIEPWHTEAVARAIATRGHSFLEGITDHLIANYIRSLAGAVDPLQTGVRRRNHKK